MKKIKDYVKKNPEPAKGRFGVNPSDPWSAKYGIAEDLSADKTVGDSRSKIAHSPTRQRAHELEKAASFYKIKTPPGSMHKKEGNQNTALTPEETQMNEAKKKMSALDKWRQASYDREKTHKEFMKSIEHLPHQQQMQKMMDKIKANRASVHKEETYMDAKAATPAVMSPGEGISEKKTTLQRVMALKKKKLKEDMHDHEKEDKSVATYGKKPKFEKAEKDEGGEKKPQAAAVMTGGTTLTGSKRDTVEIDPMMRNRPGQPDVTKKDDKKDGKDKDKKKDK